MMLTTRGRRAGRKGDASKDLPIVFEDDWMIVINKPAGLLTVPLPLERREDAPSVEDQLVTYLRPRGKRRPLVVHRIDRDTSGLVMFALRPDARERLKNQFRSHEAERIYLAVVYGHPPARGTWHDHLVWDPKSLIQKETHPRDPRGKEARTTYHVLERFEASSLLEVRLVTGKRNQIRLQARLRGHTLVGEQRYTYGPESLRSIDFPRQALHAHKLAIRHPRTDRLMRFEAPIPADLEGLLERLRSHASTKAVRASKT